MRNPDTYNVAFICTANSVRSIIAEAVLNREGRGRFRAWSAGSSPVGAVQPEVLEMLRTTGHETEGLHSKPIRALLNGDVPPFDFVITVCDRAAGAACPAWAGQPVLANWNIPDPLPQDDDPVKRHLALAETYRALHRRIGLFVELPFEALDRLARETRVRELGR